MVQTVAVGTDGSGTADKAVEFAIELAARFEARIVFISAYVPRPRRA
jgi:nucleotide-binding universal stress UspA family protein